MKRKLVKRLSRSGNALMPDKNIFDRYLLALRKTPIDDKAEHRAPPAAVLNSIT
jgi:hypothetical protein